VPRGFDEREKGRIREALLARGTELFAAHGLKKTNVEDLTRAVGISKGAFYAFFPSKEELFFAVLERFEAEFQAALVTDVFQPGRPPRECFKDFLRRAFTAWRSSALFARFGGEDLAYLRHRLPAEKLEAHVRGDEAFVAEAVARWRREGVAIDCDPKVLAGLLRALVFVSLHEDDVGREVFPEVQELLIDLVAQRVVGDTVPTGEQGAAR
jgi:AcrR family transcriptional regulator